MPTKRSLYCECTPSYRLELRVVAAADADVVADAADLAADILSYPPNTTEAHAGKNKKYIYLIVYF